MQLSSMDLAPTVKFETVNRIGVCMHTFVTLVVQQNQLLSMTLNQCQKALWNARVDPRFQHSRTETRLKPGALQAQEYFVNPNYRFTVSAVAREATAYSMSLVSTSHIPATCVRLEASASGRATGTINAYLMAATEAHGPLHSPAAPRR